jgi:hypothetical protein
LHLSAEGDTGYILWPHARMGKQPPRAHADSLPPISRILLRPVTARMMRLIAMEGASHDLPIGTIKSSLVTRRPQIMSKNKLCHILFLKSTKCRGPDVQAITNEATGDYPSLPRRLIARYRLKFTPPLAFTP